MAKEKTIVKVESKESNENDVYWKDKHGKIIKIEDKWDPVERATKRRWIAVILWLIAIAFETIWILRVMDVITWFSWLEVKYFLIICIVLDLIFFIIGSLVWKKANHIDPISEKNKLKFWSWNNLGTILSILAFLPMIIVVLMSKNLDKNSKKLVWWIAAAALIIAWLASYDYNPVSSEQLLRAEKEVQQVSPTGKVYWAPYSKKYHVDPDCPAFSNSETVYEWTVRDAYEAGLVDPCRRCIPEYKWDEDENVGETPAKEENDETEELVKAISDIASEFVK